MERTQVLEPDRLLQHVLASKAQVWIVKFRIFLNVDCEH